MGRDVLYLPTYYQKDKEQYLGSPIWLKSNGEVQFLQKQKELDTIYIKRTEGMWLKQKIDTDRSYFAGLTIIAMNNQTKAHDTLCIIDEFPNMEMNTIQIKKNIYKQIKLITQADTLAFNEIRFNGLNGIIPAQIVSCSGKLIQEKGLDGHSETSLMSVRRKKDEQHTIHIELENENELASISFYPYTSNLLDPQSEYELFYWNNGWQSFGIKKGNVDFLVWHNVPKGCLYLLKNKSKKFNSGERPFIYEEGNVIWM